MMQNTIPSNELGNHQQSGSLSRAVSSLPAPSSAEQYARPPSRGRASTTSMNNIDLSNSKNTGIHNAWLAKEHSTAGVYNAPIQQGLSGLVNGNGDMKLVADTTRTQDQTRMNAINTMPMDFSERSATRPDMLLRTLYTPAMGFGHRRTCTPTDEELNSSLRKLGVNPSASADMDTDILDLTRRELGRISKSQQQPNQDNGQNGQPVPAASNSHPRLNTGYPFAAASPSNGDGGPIGSSSKEAASDDAFFHDFKAARTTMYNSKPMLEPKAESTQKQWALGSSVWNPAGNIGDGQKDDGCVADNKPTTINGPETRNGCRPISSMGFSIPQIVISRTETPPNSQSSGNINRQTNGIPRGPVTRNDSSKLHVGTRNTFHPTPSTFRQPSRPAPFNSQALAPLNTSSTQRPSPSTSSLEAAISTSNNNRMRQYPPAMNPPSFSSTAELEEYIYNLKLIAEEWKKQTITLQTRYDYACNTAMRHLTIKEAEVASLKRQLRQAGLRPYNETTTEEDLYFVKELGMLFRMVCCWAKRFYKFDSQAGPLPAPLQSTVAAICEDPQNEAFLMDEKNTNNATRYLVVVAMATKYIVASILGMNFIDAVISSTEFASSTGGQMGSLAEIIESAKRDPSFDDKLYDAIQRAAEKRAEYFIDYIHPLLSRPNDNMHLEQTRKQFIELSQHAARISLDTAKQNAILQFHFFRLGDVFYGEKMKEVTSDNLGLDVATKVTTPLWNELRGAIVRICMLPYVKATIIGADGETRQIDAYKANVLVC